VTELTWKIYNHKDLSRSLSAKRLEVAKNPKVGSRSQIGLPWESQRGFHCVVFFDRISHPINILNLRPDRTIFPKLRLLAVRTLISRRVSGNGKLSLLTVHGPTHEVLLIRPAQDMCGAATMGFASICVFDVVFLRCKLPCLTNLD